MKRLLSLLIVLAIIVVSLGIYSQWFMVSVSRENEGNKVIVNLTLDRDKVMILGGIGVVCGAVLIVGLVWKSRSTADADKERNGLLGLKETYQANREEELKE